MDRKELEEVLAEALAKALTPVTTYFTNEETRRQAEADAAAEKGDVSEAVKTAVAALEAIKAAKVLPTLEAELIESATAGEDITVGLERAKKVTQEASAPKQEAADGVTFIYESAGDKADDFILNIGGK